MKTMDASVLMPCWGAKRPHRRDDHLFNSPKRMSLPNLCVDLIALLTPRCKFRCIDQKRIVRGAHA